MDFHVAFVQARRMQVRTFMVGGALTFLLVAGPSGARAQDQAAGDSAGPPVVGEPGAPPVVDAPPRTNLPTDRIRVMGFASLRAGGSTSYEEAGFSDKGDMEPGFGGGVRVEVPVWDYIVVGGLFQAVTVRQEFVSGRDPILDIAGWVKGRYVVPSIGSGLELYLGIHIGVSIATDGFGLGDPEVGSNVGFLPGAQYFFTDSLGVLAEMGFTRHRFRFPADEFSPVGKLSAIQLTLNVGMAFAF